MKAVLIITGAIWAIVGFVHIDKLPGSGVADTSLIFGVMLNMVLFILPGFAVYSIGAGMKKRKAEFTAPRIEENSIS
jgi:hypothetical protein